jgi:hypothetical protein
MRRGGRKMKSKKAVWLTILVALIATVGISYAQKAGKAEVKMVQELRLYFNGNGDLLKVEPINKEKYKVDRITDLRNEKITGGVAVMFGRTNPTCTYWYTYRTGSGYQRICLRWE